MSLTTEVTVLKAKMSFVQKKKKVKVSIINNLKACMSAETQGSQYTYLIYRQPSKEDKTQCFPFAGLELDPQAY